MKMVHLPDGPEQEARDAMFTNSVPKPDAEPPTAIAAPTNGKGGKRLEDFDPPAVVTGTFVPATRAYLFEYDVYLHVSRYRTAIQ